VSSIKVGDVVRLKSGGPLMTVDEVKGESASCVWFEGKNSRSLWFKMAVLEPAPDGDPINIAVG
jgi:uncharacterized protein YodC (DUF2158 family)